MKTRRKLIIGIAASVGAILVGGWLTSTRHIDMVFLEDGVPLAGCRIELIAGTQSSPQTHSLGSNGEVRFPSSLVGSKGIYAIFRDQEQLHSIYEESFDRGLTTVDFQPDGLKSTRDYRFLFYHRTTRTQSINLAKIQSEQGVSGQPATTPQVGD